MRISDWSSDVCSSDLILKRSEGAHAVLRCRNRHVEESRWLVHAITVDEGGSFGAGELHRDFAGKPAFEIEACIVEHRSEEHTSELQSLMRISYAVFCFKKKT